MPSSSWLLPLHSKPSVAGQSGDDSHILPERDCTVEGECVGGEGVVEVVVDIEQGEISAPDSDSRSDCTAEGEKVIADISNCLRDSIASSGEDILKALQIMRGNLRDIKTPAALVSALVTFGKGKCSYNGY